MSVEEGIGGFDAEKKFWGTPELVEKLLFFLDLESIKQMAASHKLTRKILGKTFMWKQLIKRIFPRDHNIDPMDSSFPQHYEDLASDKAKVKILTEIGRHRSAKSPEAIVPFNEMNFAIRALCK